MNGKRPGRPAVVWTLPSAALAALMLLPASCASGARNLSTQATTSSDATIVAPSSSQTSFTNTSPSATSVIGTSASCRERLDYGYALPDPACTPGATNPAVTQASIAQTICAEGWTNTVRPPQSYTEPLKRSQMAEYGDTRPIYGYEEDHLIPLGLGGAPSDPHNLWPEPGASPNPKDEVEGAANEAVCEGRMTLASAQGRIASDWVAFGRFLGVISASGNQ